MHLRNADGSLRGNFFGYCVECNQALTLDESTECPLCQSVLCVIEDCEDEHDCCIEDEDYYLEPDGDTTNGY